MEKTKTKIAIVGAGPSGTTLALLLAKKKIPHLLIDKESFPRDKICGDGFTPEVLRVLREIDESLFEEFINASWTKASHGSYLELNSRIHVSTNFKELITKGAAYYVAKRKDFDHWLVSKINKDYTTQMFNCKVEKVERLERGIQLSCNQDGQTILVEANLVIGADGERSIIKKTLSPQGIKKDREHNIAALRSYYRNVTPKFNQDPLEVYFLKEKARGYFWVFPLPNNEFNVGIGVVSKDISDQKLNLKKMFYDMIENHPQLKKRFERAVEIEKPKGWGIPLNSDAYDFTGDNYILIGDSSKFGEPLTGKGIGVAMHAASCAIPIIEKAIREESYTNELLSDYERIIQNKFRKEWNVLVTWQNRWRKWYIPILVLLVKLKPIHRKMSNNHALWYQRFVLQKFN